MPARSLVASAHPVPRRSPFSGLRASLLAGDQGIHKRGGFSGSAGTKHLFADLVELETDHLAG